MSLGISQWEIRRQPCPYRELSFFNDLDLDVRNCRGPQNGLSLRSRLESRVQMSRQAFTDRLKEAMKARDSRTISTVRMILAGLKERDVAVRGHGKAEGISEEEVRRMLQAMIKQRRESIALYEKGNRPDLVQQELEEIVVIESFLPRQLDEGETEAAAGAAIAEIGATKLSDMGKVMAVLRERHAGAIDLGRAGAIVRRQLG